MTLVPPSSPIIPNALQFTRPGTILNNITPFTYRDGITYLDYLEALSTYIKDKIIPFVNDAFNILEEKWGDEAVAIVDAVNAALSAQAAAIDTALIAQQTNVNTALTEQQTEVSEQLASNESAMAELATAVNNQVGTLTAFVNQRVADLTTFVNSVEFQDSTVNGIVTTLTSNTRILLDSLYATDTGGVTDADVSNLINTEGTSTRNLLDVLYGFTPPPVVADDKAGIAKVVGLLARARETNGCVVMLVGSNITKSPVATSVNDTGMGRVIRDLFQSAADSGVRFEPSVVQSLTGVSPAPGVRVVNGGSSVTVPHYATATVLANVTAFKPRIFVHHYVFDANYNSETPAETVATTSASIAAINAAGGADYVVAPPVHIIVSGAFPTDEAYTLTPDDYSEAIAEFCEQSDNYIHADLREIFAYNAGNKFGFLESTGDYLTERGFDALARGIGNTLKLPVMMDRRPWNIYDSGSRPFEGSNTNLNTKKLPSGQVWTAPAVFDNTAWGIGGLIVGPTAIGNPVVSVDITDLDGVWIEMSAHVRMPAAAGPVAGIFATAQPSDTVGAQRFEFVRSATNVQQWGMNFYAAGVKGSGYLASLPAGSNAADVWVRMVTSPFGVQGYLNGVLVIDEAWPADSPRIATRIGLYSNPAASGQAALFDSIAARLAR